MDLGNDCFNKLRQTIAIRFNKEFGEIYCSINPYLTRKEVEDLDRRAEQIITEQNLDEDILAFLFSTDSKELHFTVYIMGDGYAEYFDINEDECVIPTGVTVSGDTFTIPANPNELSKRQYTFKFVGEILNSL
jgi:hypothetical protein